MVDELSYLPFNRTRSELLFRVIYERSERAGVIISTNSEFSSLKELFENDMSISTLVDPLTYRSHVIERIFRTVGAFPLNPKGKAEQLS